MDEKFDTLMNIVRWTTTIDVLKGVEKVLKAIQSDSGEELDKEIEKAKSLGLNIPEGLSEKLKK